MKLWFFCRVAVMIPLKTNMLWNTGRIFLKCKSQGWIWCVSDETTSHLLNRQDIQRHFWKVWKYYSWCIRSSTVTFSGREPLSYNKKNFKKKKKFLDVREKHLRKCHLLGELSKRCSFTCTVNLHVNQEINTENDMIENLVMTYFQLWVMVKLTHGIKQHSVRKLLI